MFASGYADLGSFGEDLADEVVVKKPYRLAELAARLHDLRGAEAADNVIPLRP